MSSVRLQVPRQELKQEAKNKHLPVAMLSLYGLQLEHSCVIN
jgi:hypothetical protein